MKATCLVTDILAAQAQSAPTIMGINVAMNPHSMLRKAHLWRTKWFGECLFLAVIRWRAPINNKLLAVTINFYGRHLSRKKNNQAIENTTVFIASHLKSLSCNCWCRKWSRRHPSSFNCSYQTNRRVLLWSP